MPVDPCETNDINKKTNEIRDCLRDDSRNQ